MKSYTSGFPQTASTSREAAPKQSVSQFLNYFINSKLKDVVPALFTLTHGEHSSKNAGFSHLQISRAHPLPIQKPGGKDHFGFKQLCVVAAVYFKKIKKKSEQS